MLKIEAIAKVYHTCTLSDEDELKVLEYIKCNKEEFKFMGAKEQIAKAIDELDSVGEIELYKYSVESDFSTEEIKWSEFEERGAEEILESL